jgi:hypothetical protein
MDYLIGAIDHHDWADVCCWKQSAVQNGFIGKIVLLCYEHMTDHALQRLGHEGIIITRARSGRGVNEDRFRDVPDFVDTLSPDDRILMCDVRDVAFQRSIHKVLDELLATKPLACASEGVTYGDSEWNMSNAKTNFPDQLAEISKMDIYCAGVIAGRAARFSAFCRTIWQQSIQAKSFNGDQIAMNMVMRTPEYVDDMNFVPAHNSQICHHGNMLSYPRLTIGSQGLCDNEHGIIGVFHQYTRNSKIRHRTLLQHRCLLPFYGGKVMTLLRRKLGMEPTWTPYWLANQNA